MINIGDEYNTIIKIFLFRFLARAVMVEKKKKATAINEFLIVFIVLNLRPSRVRSYLCSIIFHSIHYVILFLSNN